VKSVVPGEQPNGRASHVVRPVCSMNDTSPVPAAPISWFDEKSVTELLACAKATERLLTSSADVNGATDEGAHAWRPPPSASQSPHKPPESSHMLPDNIAMHPLIDVVQAHN